MIVTTKCVLNELASQRVLGGAHYIAKHLQVRQCHHSKPLSPDECIQAMLGPDNTNHYCIATQDSTIQKVLRKRGNVPLIHIIRNTIVLEEPSDCSHEEVEKLTNEKTMPSEHECIDKQLTELGVNDEYNKVKKRKRPQGPNPLSVKKKKRMTITNKSGGVSIKNKGRRLRLQRRRAIEHLISKIETN
jgi:U3 small nucleolar RNA-associated protein 23